MQTLEFYITDERAKEDVRCGLSADQVRRTSGVHFGGMEADAWPRASDETIIARAEQRMAMRAAYERGEAFTGWRAI